MKDTATKNNVPSHRQSLRRALGLAEVLVSMLIISGLLVSALNTLGSASLGRLSNSDQARGHHLAQDLMSEILSQAYEDPNQVPVFGLEGGESAKNRSAYDDVDDYKAWNSTSLARKNGTAVAGFSGWTRTVNVAWENPPGTLSSTSPLNTGIKRITVTSLENGQVIATITALRTAGPPYGKVCLFVATDPANLNPQEAMRVALIETWGYAVTYVKDKDKQNQYDTALAGANVVYVSTEISPGRVDTKLSGATIGVVFEEPGLVPQFGFSGGTQSTSQTDTYVYVNTHEITSGFNFGFLKLFTTKQPLFTLNLWVAPDIHVLTYTVVKKANAYSALSYMETGDALYGSGTAPGRRVMLPWGADGFDFNSLNSDAKTIMQRAIDWAASTITNPLAPL